MVTQGTVSETVRDRVGEYGTRIRRAVEGAVDDVSTQLHIPGASTLYSLLGVLLLLGAVLAYTMPDRLMPLFFRKSVHYDILFPQLYRTLSALLLVAAATCHALKTASDSDDMANPIVQRIQLGFFWFSAVAVALHILHYMANTLSFTGLLLGSIMMAPTFLLPTIHLTMSGGFGITEIAESVQKAFKNILLQPGTLSTTAVFFSVLTVTFSITGLACIFFPKLTLHAIFGYHIGKPSIFLWQWIGSGLLFLVPTLTYTGLESALAGSLARPLPSTLNVALFVGSLLNLLEFGSLVMTRNVIKHILLLLFAVQWGLALWVAILSISAAGPGTLDTDILEPLMGRAESSEA